MPLSFLGNPLTLALIVLALAISGYALARGRAMVRAGGDARKLHSLPNYYGMTAAMFAAVPALGVSSVNYCRHFYRAVVVNYCRQLHCALVVNYCRQLYCALVVNW